MVVGTMKSSQLLQCPSHSKLSCACRPLNLRRSTPLKVSCAIAAPPAEEVKIRVKRNENFGKLQAGYLFPEIARRRRAHQEKHPDAKIISLGIGDTTEPIPKSIAEAMQKAAAGMGTTEGYSGYGAEQGKPQLREALCDRFYSHVGRKPSEIFVSDGSKCDIGRLQMMFGSDTTVAVQDPSYPVYVDSSVIMGMTGEYDESSKGFGNLTYMVCRPENDFFPDLSKVKPTDLIFFCNPNNPTGAAATRQQLEELVAFARKNGSILIYDAAYAIYIADSDLPQTIFEIPAYAMYSALSQTIFEIPRCIFGPHLKHRRLSKTCSFSKYAGFTGVRLGWTVVPEQLKFADGSPVINDFNRIMTTIFNGASVIAQAGGLAALQDEGFREMNDLVAFYRENAAILRKTFLDLGFSVYGGENAPYIWVGFPGKPSWDVFAEILEKCNIVTTPGSGFGPAGEGFVRASAFGHREDILEAVERFKKEFGSR